MASADFATIVQSLDSLTPMERESLSSILAGKAPAPLPVGRPASTNASARSAPISMSDADWDHLAADVDIQRELTAIEREFSLTLSDGLDGE